MAVAPASAGDGGMLDVEGRSSLRALSDHRRDRGRYVDGDAADRLNLGAVLVRPDGVVAWASSAGAAMSSIDESAGRVPS